jgi:hypothetical protein
VSRVIRAVNQPGSPNLVHDDEFARRLGYRGGLVPGVTVYGYLATLPAELWGRRWLSRGTMSARFREPVYDGEDVTLTARLDGDRGSREPGGEGEVLSLEARNPAGELCAGGRAELVADQDPPDPSRWADLPPPAQQGPAEFHEGQQLGSLRTTVSPASDPGWPARLGNSVLTANVALPPWIHVETRTHHLRSPEDGEEVVVRALVAGLWERRGHRFVDLDVLVAGEAGVAIAQLRHVAIYELAQLRGQT